MNKYSLPGADNIIRKEFPNGVTVLVRSDFSSSSVAVRGFLPCGSIYEPYGKSGLATFTAAALMRGTRAKTFEQIFELIESNGAALNFSASGHDLIFSGRALSEDLGLILNLSAEVLQTPLFPDAQVEQLRGQILTALAIRDQDTAERADAEFMRLLFPGHPYGKEDAGTFESIRSVTSQNMCDFCFPRVNNAKLTICIAGGVSTDAAVRFVENAYGSWERTLDNPLLLLDSIPTVTPSHTAIRSHIEIEEKSQMDLILGGLAPERLSLDFLPLSIGNAILGQFGMMGRIGKTVREDHGLAYYAGSAYNPYPLSGSWEVSAGINPVNLEKTLLLIHDEVNRFCAEAVSAEELDDVKSNFIGRLPLSLSNNEGVVSALSNLERYQLGFDYYREYAQRIEAVTAQEILSAAQRTMHLECAVTVTAGTMPKKG